MKKNVSGCGFGGFWSFCSGFFIGFFSTLFGLFSFGLEVLGNAKGQSQSSPHKASTVSIELHTQTNTHAHTCVHTQAPLAVVLSFISHHLDKSLP